MNANELTIQFTQEELEALKFWLSVISFQGTREQVRKPIEVYDAVVGKIEGVFVESVGDAAPCNDAAS